MQNLQIIIKESKLAENESKSILDRFSDYEKVAEQWKEKAKTLEVTSSEQKTEMAMAKEARKKFSQMRIDLDKARKELGEPAMRKWKAINAVANYLQSLINPIESYLKEQETFAEREAIRIEAEKQAKAEAEAEAKRIAEEKLRQEKINKYNDRRVELAKYAMLDIPGNFITIDTPEEDYKKILNSLKVKKANYDKEQAKIKKENERLRLERDKKEKQLLLAKQKKEKLEAEIKAKKDAEEKAKREQEEAEKKKKEEEAEKGDLGKLKTYLDKIKQIEVPHVEDSKVKEVINKIQELVNFNFDVD